VIVCGTRFLLPLAGEGGPKGRMRAGSREPDVFGGHGPRTDSGRATLPVMSQGTPFARQLRRSATPAEAYLWRQIRNRRLSGLKFVRQHTIGNYIADFACRDARLVVEVDGGSHFAAGSAERDAIRTAKLNGLGYQVIRFRSDDVLRRTGTVLEMIAEAAQKTFYPSPDALLSMRRLPSPQGERANPSA